MSGVERVNPAPTHLATSQSQTKRTRSVRNLRLCPVEIVKAILAVLSNCTASKTEITKCHKFWQYLASVCSLL